MPTATPTREIGHARGARGAGGEVRKILIAAVAVRKHCRFQRCLPSVAATDVQPSDAVANALRLSLRYGARAHRAVNHTTRVGSLQFQPCLSHCTPRRLWLSPSLACPRGLGGHGKAPCACACGRARAKGNMSTMAHMHGAPCNHATCMST